MTIEFIEIDGRALDRIHVQRKLLTMQNVYKKNIPEIEKIRVWEGTGLSVFWNVGIFISACGCRLVQSRQSRVDSRC